MLPDRRGNLIPRCVTQLKDGHNPVGTLIIDNQQYLTNVRLPGRTEAGEGWHTAEKCRYNCWWQATATLIIIAASADLLWRGEFTHRQTDTNYPANAKRQ